jgi:ribonuclease Z
LAIDGYRDGRMADHVACRKICEEESKPMSEFEITFLGTSAAVPTITRGLPATLIQYNGQRFLVDCGEGTQRQMMQYGGLKAPDAIFLTHYHPDHDLGLPGLLATLKMAEHDSPLTIYGPPGLWGAEKLCVAAGGNPRFTRWIEVEPGQDIYFDGITITPFVTEHGCIDRQSGKNSSVGYLFKENDRPGRFNVDLARELGVEPGPDYSKLQNGEGVWDKWNLKFITPDRVIGKSRRGRQVAITGDTAPSQLVEKAVNRVDLLIHEATFTMDQVGRANKVKHSTIQHAMNIAANAVVGNLVLTHFSPRSEGKVMREEVAQWQAICPPTRLAHDGLKLTISTDGEVSVVKNEVNALMGRRIAMQKKVEETTKPVLS